MKVGDLLKDFPEWKEMFRLTADLMDAGKAANDGGLYLAGMKLARLIGNLANKEVEECSE